jgi:hypothetical protein
LAHFLEFGNFIGQLLRKDKLSHPPQSYLALLSLWLSYTVSHSWNVR